MDILQKTVLAQQLRRDPPRVDPKTGEEETRVRVRVVSDVEGAVECGHVFNVGEHYVEVYASEAEHLKKQVETFLLEPVFERAMRVKPRTETTMSGLEPQIEHLAMEMLSEDERKLPEDAQIVRAAENRKRVDREYAKALAEHKAASEGGAPYRRPYLPSAAAAFRVVMGRDSRPFASVTVLATDGEKRKRAAA